MDGAGAGEVRAVGHAAPPGRDTGNGGPAKAFPVRPAHEAKGGGRAVISTLIREPARIAALPTAAGRNQLREKASDLVSRCRKYPTLVSRRWDDVKKMASQSVWLGDDLQPYFSFLLSMTDLCLSTIRLLREALEEPGARKPPGRLGRVAATLGSLRTEVSGVWDWLRPRLPSAVSAPPPKSARSRPAANTSALKRPSPRRAGTLRSRSTSGPGGFAHRPGGRGPF